jgi:hypothetical protein
MIAVLAGIVVPGWYVTSYLHFDMVNSSLIFFINLCGETTLTNFVQRLTPCSNPTETPRNTQHKAPTLGQETG